MYSATSTTTFYLTVTVTVTVTVTLTLTKIPSPRGPNLTRIPLSGQADEAVSVTGIGLYAGGGRYPDVVVKLVQGQSSYDTEVQGQSTSTGPELIRHRGPVPHPTSDSIAAVPACPQLPCHPLFLSPSLMSSFECIVFLWRQSTICLPLDPSLQSTIYDLQSAYL